MNAPAKPPAAMTPTANPWRSRVIVLAMFTVVAGVFAPIATHGPVQIDDLQAVFFNPHLNPPNFDDTHVLWYFSHGDPGLYIPLYYCFLGVLAKATYVQTADPSGIHLDPHIFHAASIAIHLANLLLVYAILRRINLRQWAAVGGAMFFALHPLQVETVAWTVGLRDLLFATFSFSSVLLYLSAAAPKLPPRRRIPFYVAGLLLVPAGMLFKPTVIVAPLIAGAIDLLILRSAWRRVALRIAPYILAAIPLAIVARAVQPSEAIPSPDLWQRPIVAGVSLAFYTGKLVAPTGITFDYGLRPLTIVSQPKFWLIGILGLILPAGLLLGRRRWPFLAAGVGVFILALLPVLGLTPFSFQFYSTVADHYLAVAMLGPAILFAWGVQRFGRPAAFAAVPWVVTLAILSAHQLTFWKDGLTMAQRTVAMNPSSALGHNALGEIAQTAYDLPTAEREYRASTSNPDFLAGPDNLARILAAEGKPDEAIAAFHLMRKTAARFPVQARPTYRGFLQYRLADIALEAGRPNDARRYVAEEYSTFGSLLGRR